jgi:Tfp pilus assembly protein PilO
MTGALLLALLAVAAVVAVAWPLLRAPASDDVAETADPETLLRLDLRERRDAALAALQELELDHRTGKLDDADYEQARAELRAEAAAAIEALERAGVESAP